MNVGDEQSDFSRSGEPLWRLAYRFLWPFQYFRDVTRGSSLERQQNYRHNRAMRVYLPGFIMKEAASAGSSFNVLVSALFIPGDFDHNGYVDAADLDIFLACGTGPAGAYAASGCSLSPDGEGYVAADLDRDHDVDQVDFGVFQRCYSGALPGNPGCAD